MEGISLSMAALVINLLGLPGLIFIIWHFDQRKIDRILREFREENQAILKQYREETQAILTQYREETRQILAQYREDVFEMRRLYDNNVQLVKGYEKMSGDLAGMIHLNTQVTTQLSERIENNLFCPMVRKEVHG